MNVFTKKNMDLLPYELVDIIADYHDYHKYCKPAHIEKLKEVINDIGDMAAIMDIDNHIIPPNLVWQCWGAGADEFHDFWDILDNEEVWTTENDNLIDIDIDTDIDTDIS